MRKPMHVLSKGYGKKGQQKIVQEGKAREGTEMAIKENAMKQSEKSNVASPETNII